MRKKSEMTSILPFILQYGVIVLILILTTALGRNYLYEIGSTLANFY